MHTFFFCFVFQSFNKRFLFAENVFESDLGNIETLPDTAASSLQCIISLLFFEKEILSSIKMNPFYHYHFKSIKYHD